MGYDAAITDGKKCAAAGIDAEGLILTRICSKEKNEITNID
jgi:hypothetical protein